MSKKIGLLKSIGALCSIVLLSGTVTSPTVFAAESMCTADTGTGSEAAVYAGDELSAEMDGFYRHMLFDDTLQEGEERVLGMLNGEKFCVRVTDVTESSPSAYAATSTTSKVFTFYKENALGVKKDVLNVTYNGGSGIIYFGANLSLDRQTLTLKCSEDF